MEDLLNCKSHFDACFESGIRTSARQAHLADTIDFARFNLVAMIVVWYLGILVYWYHFIVIVADA